MLVRKADIIRALGFILICVEYVESRRKKVAVPRISKRNNTSMDYIYVYISLYIILLHMFFTYAVLILLYIYIYSDSWIHRCWCLVLLLLLYMSEALS